MCDPSPLILPLVRDLVIQLHTPRQPGSELVMGLWTRTSQGLKPGQRIPGPRLFLSAPQRETGPAETFTLACWVFSRLDSRVTETHQGTDSLRKQSIETSSKLFKSIFFSSSFIDVQLTHEIIRGF